MIIASSEPRNISLTIFDAKNIMNIISVLFEPKKYHFDNILTQKYWTYLPVCACAECPPWDTSITQRINLGSFLWRGILFTGGGGSRQNFG